MINHTKKCYTDYTSIPNFKTPLLEMVYYWVYNIISHNQPHSLVWRFWPPMIAASSLKMPFEVDSSTFSCWWIHPLSIVKSGQPKINPAYCTTIHQLEIKCQRIGCRENQNRKLPLFFWHMGGGVLQMLPQVIPFFSGDQKPMPSTMSHELAMVHKGHLLIICAPSWHPYA